jgi:hypothetical protein
VTGCRGFRYDLKGHCPLRPQCAHWRDDESTEPHQTITTCGHPSGGPGDIYGKFVPIRAQEPQVFDGEGSDLD